MFKKILFSLFFLFNIVHAKDEVMLTFEEMEELIKDFPGYLVNEVHSKKGLEKLLTCVNKFDACDHSALLNFQTNEKAKKLLDSIKNESDYKKYDILYRDLYLKNGPVNVSHLFVIGNDYKSSIEIELRSITKSLFRYLSGCLAYKKRFIKK